MTLVVRNGEELLETNLEYHYAQGVDVILVTDHRSEDATARILERYSSSGRLRSFRIEDGAFRQALWVTEMARRAAIEEGADWVINADVDEFWYPETGTLKSVLESIPQQFGRVRAPRYNFVPVDGDEGVPFWRRMVVRENTNYSRVLGNRIRPKTCHRALPKIFVGPGNHVVWGRPERLALLPGPSPMVVLHYPYRTYPQVVSKITVGAAAVRAHTDLGPMQYLNWLDLDDRHRESGYLRQFWEDTILTPERLAQGLASGELVEDRRLADFLEASSLRA